MLTLLFFGLNEAAPNPPPNPDVIELLGGGPGGPRKRKEYDKDSYMARLLGRPINEWPDDFEPEPEVIEVIEEAVKAPAPLDTFAAAQAMKALGLAYQEAYAQAYTEIYLSLLAQRRQDDEDEAVATAIAMLL